jgi:hypothetical protein
MLEVWRVPLGIQLRTLVLTAGQGEVGTEVYRRIFTRKTKRPRLKFESWASVDQPSPKCCSRTTVALGPHSVNGSPVLCMARRWGRPKTLANERS